MIVSIHQPIYLPWLAYFDKIRKSDIHVVLDHVTVGKNDLCNRNKIRTANGWEWLTIPIKNKGSRSTAIRDIEIAKGWQNRHWSKLHENYRRTPFWNQHQEFLDRLYGENFQLLQGPVLSSIGHLCDAFRIHKPIKFSTDLKARGQKSELNLNICKELGATVYLSGPFGRTYLDIPSFEAAGIEVRFTDFKHPVYNQAHGGDFVPGMSAIDALLNTGGFPE